MALIGGFAAGMAHPVAALMEGKPDDALKYLTLHYTGYDSWTGGLSMGGLQRGLVPLIIGAAVHKFVGGAPLNVNRALGSAGVPFLRI